MVEQLEFDNQDWEAITKGDKTKEEVTDLQRRCLLP
jgi:hypothetical protein